VFGKGSGYERLSVPIKGWRELVMRWVVLKRCGSQLEYLMCPPKILPIVS